MNRQAKQHLVGFCMGLLVILKPALGIAQVNSGSNGGDGAFNPATNTVIDMHDHPNGVYQYTSVNVSNGIAVTFIPNANNTPVTWLVQSNCVISGTVDVSGQSQNGAIGGLGGPAGWIGGVGGSNPTSGQGPGGGYAGTGSLVYGGNGSFGTAGDQAQSQAASGSVYGNVFLIPLTGGSGGGGSSQGGAAGGGGGAILIAANGQITLTGSILANGGNGFVVCPGPYCYSTGAGGSGGAIRLVATTILGSGTVSAIGGAGFYGLSPFDGSSGGNPEANNAGNGVIRFDTFQDSFGGTTEGNFTQGFQPIIIPVAGQGVQLSIASVAGSSVSATPSGQLASPDTIISGQQTNPISVVVNCSNLPLNTPITVTVNPANGSPVSVLGYNTTGTLTSSTATVSLVMPRGGGIIYATTGPGN